MNRIQSESELQGKHFFQNSVDKNSKSFDNKIESPFLKILQSQDMFRESLSDPTFMDRDAFAPIGSQDSSYNFHFSLSNHSDSIYKIEQEYGDKRSADEIYSSSNKTVQDNDSDEDIDDEEGDDDMDEDLNSRRIGSRMHFLYEGNVSIAKDETRSREISSSSFGLFGDINELSVELGNRKSTNDKTKGLISDKDFILSKASIDGNGKQSQEMKDWEKKTLTSADLIEKIKMELDGNKSYSETSSGKNAKIKISDNIEKNQKSNVKPEGMIPSGDTTESEGRLIVDKDSVKVKEKSIKDTQLPIGKKSSESFEDSKIQNGKESTEGKVVASPKERLESIERVTDTNRWEIQKERNRQELRNGMNSQNQSESASKKTSEGISGIHQTSQSNSKGNEGQSGLADMNRQNFTANSLRSRLDSTPSESPRMSTLEKKENLDNLIKQAKIQILGNQKSQAEIRMNPDELGRMVLKISVNKDKVEGKIFVESESVKLSLQNDMSQLREDLKLQGLKLESLEIDLAFQDGKDFAENSGKRGFNELVEKGRVKFASDDSHEPIVMNRTSDALLDIVA